MGVDHTIVLRFAGDREQIIRALEIAAVRMDQAAEWPGMSSPEDRGRNAAEATTFRRIAGDIKATTPTPVPIVSYSQLETAMKQRGM